MSDLMGKMTKAQLRRAYISLIAKASKLWVQDWKHDVAGGMSTKDYTAIQKICEKNLKKLK